MSFYAACCEYASKLWARDGSSNENPSKLAAGKGISNVLQLHLSLKMSLKCSHASPYIRIKFSQVSLPQIPKKIDQAKMNPKPTHKTPSNFQVYMKVTKIKRKLFEITAIRRMKVIESHKRDKSGREQTHTDSMCCSRAHTDLVQANALNVSCNVKNYKIYINCDLSFGKNDLTQAAKRVHKRQQEGPQWHRYCPLPPAPAASNACEK